MLIKIKHSGLAYQFLKQFKTNPKETLKSLCKLH